MNIRNVLKTYSLLRTLSDDETALLNTLRGMNEGERELLVSSLAPTPQKKVARKSNKGASKSSRAASIGTQLQQVRHAPDAVCAFVHNGSGKVCSESWANAIHDENAGYSLYHKYVSESAQAATAGGE